MKDKCFYCESTGYIHTKDNIPDQMCPHCEIGQAVIVGYNHARDIGVQACDTLRAAKDEQIKELEGKYENEKEMAAKAYTACGNYQQRIKELETENDKFRDALVRIDNWAKAYPLDVFLKPDLKKAAKVLNAVGMTLDAITGDAMRHVIEGVKDITEQALKGE